MRLLRDRSSNPIGFFLIITSCLCLQKGCISHCTICNIVNRLAVFVNTNEKIMGWNRPLLIGWCLHKKASIVAMTSNLLDTVENKDIFCFKKQEARVPPGFYFSFRIFKYSTSRLPAIDESFPLLGKGRLKRSHPVFPTPILWSFAVYLFFTPQNKGYFDPVGNKCW